MQAVPTFDTIPIWAPSGSKVSPSAGTIDTGYLPGVIYPAQHNNWAINLLTREANFVNPALTSVMNEVINSITASGASLSGGSTNQLLTALQGGSSGLNLNAYRFRGNALDNFVLGNTVQGSTTVSDLDTIVRTGAYQCSSGATGVPNTGSSFSVWHIAHPGAATYASQIAISQLASPVMYIRYELAGVWGSWSTQIQAPNKLLTDAPSTYPIGFSCQYYNTGGLASAPYASDAAYAVETITPTSNGFRSFQFAMSRAQTLPMMIRATNGSDAWSAWRTVYDSATDGAGSGLDADFVRGQSSIVSYDNNTGSRTLASMEVGETRIVAGGFISNWQITLPTTGLYFVIGANSATGELKNGGTFYTMPSVSGGASMVRRLS